MADSNNRHSEGLRLKPHISVSQARFALSNFSLSNFGVDGPYFVDVIEFCVDVNQLQEVLWAMRNEVRDHYPDRMPALVICVREANGEGEISLETGAISPPRAHRASDAAKPVVRTAPMTNGSSSIAHETAPGEKSSSQSLGAEVEALHLKAGISLAQARFALSEFCLDQFGARGQRLVDTIDRCADVASLQDVLDEIGSGVRDLQRGSFRKLSDCVREINETND